MEPTHGPRSTTAEPTAPPDDAIVAYLRTRAPGPPTTVLDARAVTSRARRALRRRHRRIRNTSVTAGGTAAAYLLLVLTGPVAVPGVGTLNVPGGHELRAMVGDLIPGPPGPDQWPTDAARLEAELIPVVEQLDVDYYLLELEPERCRLLEYSRGDYSDPECSEMAPFDARATADFDRLTAAVERSGVDVERIRRHAGGIYIPLHDSSWQYNWEYVYLPDGGSPPRTTWPEERWTHIDGNWWFYRARDD
jgi:hypothetical protein